MWVGPSDEWVPIDVIGHDPRHVPGRARPECARPARRWTADVTAHIPAIDRITETVLCQSAIPHIPEQTSPELRRLAAIARTTRGGLIIEAVSERLAVDAIKATDPRLDQVAWGWWQVNSLDAGQVQARTDALLCGDTHVLIWPGSVVGIELGTQVDAQTGEPVLGADGQPVTAGAPFRYGTDLVWTSENPQTRFGSFEATDLRPIIEAVEQDIKHLAAVSRTPAHYLLGSSANPPSAEALLAAESGLVAKAGRRQLGFGEVWEQDIRVAAIAAGEPALASDQALQVTWRNTQVRSPGAVADALLKLRQAGIPLEVLLEWIGFSPLSVTRTMELARAEAAAQASAQATAYGVG